MRLNLNLVSDAPLVKKEKEAVKVRDSRTERA